MPATRATLSRWFDEGVEKGHTHMIVRCDDFDYHGNPDDPCCYPVYMTKDGEDSVREEAHHGGGDRLMEVYDLRMDKEEQFAQRRTFNY